MAKFKFIQQVAVDIPGGGTKTWNVGDIIEAEYGPVGGEGVVITIVQGVSEPVKIAIPLVAVEEVTDSGMDMKKWLYLGAAALLVFWYVNRSKKTVYTLK